MKKYICSSLIIWGGIFCLHLKAQVNVGINTENIHSNAILSIQNNEASKADPRHSRAMKFPNVNDMTDLQRYNASKSNPGTGTYIYDPDPSIEGMITYVKTRGDLMYFDGTTWNPFFSKGKAGITRVETVEGENPGFAFVLGISGGVTPNFRKIVQDDLGITGIDESFCDTIWDYTGSTPSYTLECSDNLRNLEIPESGMYEITLGLKLNAAALINLGFSNIEMEIAGWINGSQRYSHYVNIGSFIEIGKITSSNTSFSMFLRARDRVRFSVRFPWKRIAGGGSALPNGYINLVGGKDTYAIFRRVF